MTTENYEAEIKVLRDDLWDILLIKILARYNSIIFFVLTMVYVLNLTGTISDDIMILIISLLSVILTGIFITVSIINDVYEVLKRMYNS